MYRCITELKALVIDVDSFENINICEWDEIISSYNCLFLTSVSETQKKLKERFGLKTILGMKEYLAKWAPTPVLHMYALKALNVQTTELAYVSCNILFLRRALTFCSGTIWITNHVGYEDISTSPDILYPDFLYFKNHLKLGIGGYVGESIVSGKGDRNRLMVAVMLEKQPELRMRVLGRYYSYTHYMSQKHLYSSAVFLNKNPSSKAFGVYNDTFLKLYEGAIHGIMKHTDVYGVCSVPPHLGEKNCFHMILDQIENDCNIKNLENQFRCIREYPKQKGRSSADRQENISGVFAYDGRLDGKTVIILDDVVTTGATIKECAKVMYQAGAKLVLPIVLAVNQYPGNYWSSEQPDVLCPKCGMPMKLLINSKTKKFFYSCTRCKTVKDFEVGWKEFCSTVNKQIFETE